MLRRLALQALLLAAVLLVAAGIVPAVSAATCRSVTNSTFSWALDRDPACGEPGYEDRAGRTILAVVHDGTRFIGAGTGGAPMLERRPAIAVTSVDGRAWSETLLPHDGARFERRGFESPVNLASRAGVTALVGAGVAASSSNGVTWQVGTAPAASAAVMDVAAGTSRWTAVGYATAPQFGTPPGPAAIWSSRDGRSWTRIKTYATFCPEGISARGNRFVAVGSDCARTPSAVILTSADGLSWSRHRLPSTRPGGLHDVVAVANGFLAAGDDRSSSGGAGVAIWSSADGRTWRRVAFFTAQQFGEEIVKLVVTSRGVAAIAERGFLTDGLEPTAFFSRTGTSGWARAGALPNPGYGSEDGDLITDAAASERRIVAVGWFNDPDPGSQTAGGLVWRGVVRR